METSDSEPSALFDLELDGARVYKAELALGMLATKLGVALHRGGAVCAYIGRIRGDHAGPNRLSQSSRRAVHHASGNAIAKTTAKEAAVLNALRSDTRRFDAIWLAAAQRTLGVAGVSGAMNTETLRAMQARARNPALGVAGILEASFLSGIVEGSPFIDNESDFEDDAAAAGARTPADRAAQAAGYESYRAYKADWVAITFLGHDLGPPNGGGSGRGHPYLAARLHAAEAFLRQRHPGLADDAVARAVGWNGRGNSAYGDALGTTTSHPHTMGLAVDFDPAQNPYIFDESTQGLTDVQIRWWITTFEEMFRIATRIYGGEPLVAGGNSAMVWLAAELEIIVRSQEPGEPSSTASHAVRAVELLDAASGWKVVAASFTEVRPLEQLRQSLGPIPSPTAPGPLAKLLASPDDLAVLASDQVVVFGTDAPERAVGQPAAKALLARWRSSLSRSRKPTRSARSAPPRGATRSRT
jgi:hypothetical protein